MKWMRIDKTQVVAPTSGTYKNWKPRLAQEAQMQCVYCCIHESQFGGMRNFHVEHFRPQSKFPALQNDYSNLFYACGICNSFKSDDWQGELAAGEFHAPGYPYPAEVDYGDFLRVDEASGSVEGEGVTGRYIVERLHLNRAQMIALRTVSALFERIGRCQDEIEVLLNNGAIPDGLRGDVIGLLLRNSKLQRRYMEASPYSADQLRVAGS